MADFLVRSGIIIDKFEDSSTWSISAGEKSDDTVFTKGGSKSMRVTTTSGGSSAITKTISLSLSQYTPIRLHVYVPDVTTLSEVDLFFSSTSNFAKYFSKMFTSAFGWRNGWNEIVVNHDDFTNNGGESWTNIMIRVRITLYAVSGQICTVYYDELTAGEHKRPKVIFTFDDGWDSQYTQAFLYMDKVGMRGTCYLVGNYIDGSNFMTSAQIAALYEAGWDLGNHTIDHSDLTALNGVQNEIQSKIRQMTLWLENRGYTRASKHLAYPGGANDSNVLLAMRALGMLTGRTVGQGLDKMQPIAFDAPLQLRVANIANTVSLATVQSYINLAIKNGVSVILVFHRLVTTPTVSTEWAISDFENLVYWLHAKKPQVDVSPLSEVYRMATKPRQVISYDRASVI